MSIRGRSWTWLHRSLVRKRSWHTRAFLECAFYLFSIALVILSFVINLIRIEEAFLQFWIRKKNLKFHKNYDRGEAISPMFLHLSHLCMVILMISTYCRPVNLFVMCWVPLINVNCFSSEVSFDYTYYLFIQSKK